MNLGLSSKLFEQQYQRRFAIRLILRALVQAGIILFIARGHADQIIISLVISLSLYTIALFLHPYREQLANFILILGDIPALIACIHLPSHELGFEAFVAVWLIGITVANLRNGIPNFLPLYIAAAWAVIASHAFATPNPMQYLIVQGSIIILASMISLVIVLERGHNRLDELTKVLNRSAGLKELSLYMRRQPQHSLAFIDLKGFKAINDQHGHVIGDDVLRIIAARLSKSVKRKGLVLRYGGDEFIAISSYPNLQERLKNVFLEPVHLDSISLQIDARIGTICGSENMKLKDVVREADKRMYQERETEIAASLITNKRQNPPNPEPTKLEPSTL